MIARRILFVCTGNICRSPLAHALLENALERRGQSGYEVESAGLVTHHLGEQADSRMRSTARAHGVSIDHRSRSVSRADMDHYDLIVAMDDGHLRELSRMAGSRDIDIVKMRAYDPEVPDESAPDVPDPWYGGMDGFEKVFAMVERSVNRLADELVSGQES